MTTTADHIRLTLPGRGSFADVAAETAATVALRAGFGGAEVDRLRRQVTAAFIDAADSLVAPADSILVELVVERGEVAVHVAGDPNPAGRLRRHHARA